MSCALAYCFPASVPVLPATTSPLLQPPHVSLTCPAPRPRRHTAAPPAHSQPAPAPLEQKNADLALARQRKAENEAKSYDTIHTERKLTYEEEEAEWEESQKHG